MGENKRQLGARYENLAAEYLAAKGYEIVERNFRCRQGEIDLIARDGAYLVFVEVKYRLSAGSGLPLEAVDRYKQQKLIRVAQYYMKIHGCPLDTDCRFDVVAILHTEITHIKNAFWT